MELANSTPKTVEQSVAYEVLQILCFIELFISFNEMIKSDGCLR